MQNRLSQLSIRFKQNVFPWPTSQKLGRGTTFWFIKRPITCTWCVFWSLKLQIWSLKLRICRRRRQKRSFHHYCEGSASNLQTLPSVWPYFWPENRRLGVLQCQEPLHRVHELSSHPQGKTFFQWPARLDLWPQPPWLMAQKDQNEGSGIWCLGGHMMHITLPRIPHSRF